MLPISLEVLDVSGGNYENDDDDDDDDVDDGDDDGNNTNKFTGGIPSEWGALTNLKKLKMAYCGLDGKLPSIRAEHISFGATKRLMRCCRTPTS